MAEQLREALAEKERLQEDLAKVRAQLLAMPLTPVEDNVHLRLFDYISLFPFFGNNLSSQLTLSLTRTNSKANILNLILTLTISYSERGAPRRA